LAIAPISNSPHEFFPNCFASIVSQSIKCLGDSHLFLPVVVFAEECGLFRNIAVPLHQLRSLIVVRDCIHDLRRTLGIGLGLLAVKGSSAKNKCGREHKADDEGGKASPAMRESVCRYHATLRRTRRPPSRPPRRTRLADGRGPGPPRLPAPAEAPQARRRRP